MSRNLRFCKATKASFQRRGLMVPLFTRDATNLARNIGKRNQSTASPQARPASASSLSTDKSNDLSHVQPLVRPIVSEMDETFIGMTGGEIFHEMMLRKNVKHIFAYPGGAILPVMDAIYDSRDLKVVQPQHEQGAGHMAEGYSRASGKPGVVLVTSGPGATNIITPLQNALSDGIPLIVFSGQVPTPAIGSDAFQEADILGISRACTKWNTVIASIEELPRRINEAFEIAIRGRPGPVLLDLPKDVSASILRKAISTKSTIPDAHSSRSSSTAAAKHTETRLSASIRRVAELINKAKQPVIYAGHGIVVSENGPRLLKELAEKASIPVTTTLHGLGGYDELDEKSLHMLGMHGSAYANMSMQNADLIIALGARFDDRVTMNVKKFAPAAREAESEGRGGIVHFEILPKNINKVVQVTEAVEGDVAQNLMRLLPHVDWKPMDERRGWFRQISEWKSKWPLNSYRVGHAERAKFIKPQAVIEELSNVTANRKDTIISTGVGLHQLWTAQHFRWRRPRTFITSGGLGTMGYGLPAAIGAKVARPDALVIDIDGDSSFRMTLQELATASYCGIGIKIIILNNEEQGMLAQWQSLFFEDRFALAHHRNPDFMKLAEAMGVQHRRRLVEPGEVVDALQWLVDTNGPALLEAVVDNKVPLLPFVPPGGGLDEFISWDVEKDKSRRVLMRQRTGGMYG